MFKWTMPKFLSDLTPQDWFKLAGLAVAGTLLYSDVQGSLKTQAEKNAVQDAALANLDKKVDDALNRQIEVNERIADSLNAINRSLGAIEASNQQMDKRIERIERKL